MELSIINKEGKDTGRKVTLNDSIFGVTPNEHAIWLDVRNILANRRQGTHKSKERAEISRTTKKHHKQKGTGGARYGSLKGPLHRGGGTAFGPRPRSYGFKLNKKVKQLARFSALSMKAKENAIKVLEGVEFQSPKTKDFVSFAKNIELGEKKFLLVLGEPNKNVYLSSRNLQGVNVITSSDLNTYDIMRSQNIVFTEQALGNLETTISK
ncbi:MAG: 50S ribosomal protein L4 [Cryomorphaceae bacterium]|jgi:large subunit ribosomal protein L4|nr:50S ribosomal protein L4 [Cryomorphaceae bacterium]